MDHLKHLPALLAPVYVVHLQVSLPRGPVHELGTVEFPVPNVGNEAELAPREPFLDPLRPVGTARSQQEGNEEERTKHSEAAR